MLSVVVRMAYETLNMILKIISFVVWNLCACVAAPAGDNIKIQCTLTKAQPGIPCNVGRNILKMLFKISFGIWKAYSMLANICFTPISDIL